MAADIAQAFAHLPHDPPGGRRPFPQFQLGNDRRQHIKRGGAEEHRGGDAEPGNDQAGQSRSQDPHSVPDDGLHSGGVGDMLPLHQSGKDAGPAGLVKSLADAGAKGGQQDVPRLHPAQQHQGRQQANHGGGNALRRRHQAPGFQAVGHHPAQQVQGQGRRRHGQAQIGQIALLPGQVEHQPAQGELKQHLMPGDAGQQGQPVIAELAVAHGGGQKPAQTGGISRAYFSRHKDPIVPLGDGLGNGFWGTIPFACGGFILQQVSG